jgi:PadR family transcriptional regulator
MTGKREEIPYGTLDMLILKTVAHGRKLHGFEIAERIQNLSDDVLCVEEGSLYPALQRLLVNGWLIAEWGRTVENRRARYYRLTASGRRQLTIELQKYRRVGTAIGRITEPA